MHARSLGATQREPREADLNQQRIAADRPLGNDPDFLTAHETKLAQTAGNRIIQVGVFDFVDHCGGTLGEFGKPHWESTRK